MTKKHAFVLITTAVVLLVFSVLKIMQIFKPKDQLTPVQAPTEYLQTGSTSSLPATTSLELLSEGQRQILEDYLKVNLSLLSPKHEVLGGKFYLTNLKLIDANNAVISYEDGHISFDAKIKFFFVDNNPSLTQFTIIAENGQLYIENSSSSPASPSFETL